MKLGAFGIACIGLATVWSGATLADLPICYMENDPIEMTACYRRMAAEQGTPAPYLDFAAEALKAADEAEIKAHGLPPALTPSKMTGPELCQTFHDAHGEPRDKQAVLQEIKARGATDQDVTDITASRLRVGMPDFLIICRLGLPLKANTSGGSWGSRVQYVFGDFGPYVYVVNGRVEAWQF